jgi:hypothetical protein
MFWDLFFGNMAHPCWSRQVKTSPIGMLFIAIILSSLSQAYRRQRRSDPLPGTMVELGFLGTVFDVEIPRSVDEQQVSSSKGIHGGGVSSI